MIRTLDDLIALSEACAEDTPFDRDRLLIRRGGCTEEEIARLREELPDIPDSYLNIVRKVNLHEIVVGFFALSPEAFRATNLTDSLIAANNPEDYPMMNWLRRDRAYHVASWEADPIGVAYERTRFSPGQIIVYNCGNPDEPAQLLADTFLQFLLLVGNLYELVRAKLAGENDRVVYEEFMRRVWACPVAERFAMTWELIARVTLLD